MSRANRQAGMESTLEGLESDFERDLIEALKRCSSGMWGLFGQNDRTFAGLPRRLRDRLLSPDAAKLLELGDEIEHLRAELGMPSFDLYQRFLEYRRRRDANAPGEPKLARQLLNEISA